MVQQPRPMGWWPKLRLSTQSVASCYVSMFYSHPCVAWLECRWGGILVSKKFGTAPLRVHSNFKQNKPKLIQTNSITHDPPTSLWILENWIFRATESRVLEIRIATPQYWFPPSVNVLITWVWFNVPMAISPKGMHQSDHFWDHFGGILYTNFRTSQKRKYFSIHEKSWILSTTTTTTTKHHDRQLSDRSWLGGPGPALSHARRCLNTQKMRLLPLCQLCSRQLKIWWPLSECEGRLKRKNRCKKQRAIKQQPHSKKTQTHTQNEQE